MMMLKVVVFAMVAAHIVAALPLKQSLRVSRSSNELAKTLYTGARVSDYILVSLLDLFTASVFTNFVHCRKI